VAVNSLRGIALPALLALLALGCATAQAAPDAYDAFAVQFKRDLANNKADVRLAAFARAQELKDARAIDLVLEGIRKEVGRADVTAKQQEKHQEQADKILGEIEKANAAPQPKGREVEAYNAKMLKLTRERDTVTELLRELGVEAAQGRAVIGAGTTALGKLLQGLPADVLGPTLTRIESAWLGPKATVGDRIRWIETLTRVTSAPASSRLSAAARDEALDPRVRAAALEARVTRRDEGALEDALLLLGGTDFVMRAAATEALRSLHAKGAIEPLIALLAKEDLGELRTRVHLTLRSLTAQPHGPYEQPWREWWQTARATFVMPERPAESSLFRPPEKGLTFYGITTFSDRILFVLDVSGSMLDPAHVGATGKRADERKIDVLRKELAGTIEMLDEKKRFNLLLFNHRVIRYQAGALTGDRANRDAAKRWALGIEPSSGTNIHDSLEVAFRLAGTDGKGYQTVFDTIYYMTDGTPTAGKLQKPDEILAAVAEWNRVAHVTVHCIAVGDSADEKFLQALAAANYGQYVKR
jgi:hypothetical protein